MEHLYNPMESEMKDLADQVREHYPFHPEFAFQYFCLTYPTYPNIVSATMVSLLWNYMDFEQMMKTGMKFTRPMERHDLQLFRSPFLLN